LCVLTVSTAGGKEAGNLVAKGSIVSVLHDSHQLDSVVAQLLDTGQHVGRELCELANAGLSCRNTNWVSEIESERKEKVKKKAEAKA
jgi:hypothetical protein